MLWQCLVSSQVNSLPLRSFSAIGVDQVGQGGQIPLVLILVGILQVTNADVDILGLNMANHTITPGQDKIRRTATLRALVRSGR